MRKARLRLGARVLALVMMVWVEGVAMAQSDVGDTDSPDERVPLPAVTSQKDLLKLEMPPHVSMSIGVDPASVAITPDGLVRYVVVARNESGSAAVMFEAIRCETGEVKTYARLNSAGQWVRAKAPQWALMTGNMPSKHALAFARQGACDGQSAPATSVPDIIKAFQR